MYQLNHLTHRASLIPPGHGRISLSAPRGPRNPAIPPTYIATLEFKGVKELRWLGKYPSEQLARQAITDEQSYCASMTMQFR